MIGPVQEKKKRVTKRSFVLSAYTRGIFPPFGIIRAVSLIVSFQFSWVNNHKLLDSFASGKSHLLYGSSFDQSEAVMI